MRLFILVPECDAEGESPWDWVQNTQPWTELNDAQQNGSGRLGETWLPLKLRIVHRDRPGDFYDFSTHPIVSPRAWDVIHSVVGESVESLPVHIVNGGPLLLLNVLDRVPLASGSETSYHAMKGFSTLIHRFVFRELDLIGKVIFRVIGEGVSYDHCVVAEPFMKSVLTSGLIGADFIEIDWHPDPLTEHQGAAPMRLD
jgi:hypothetical protein